MQTIFLPDNALFYIIMINPGNGSAILFKFT